MSKIGKTAEIVLAGMPGLNLTPAQVKRAAMEIDRLTLHDQVMMPRSVWELMSREIRTAEGVSL